MRVRRPTAGFTLVEMMVVVAIVAILVGLLISTSSRPVGANARNMSEQIVSTINFAKLRASATRRVHTVQVTSTQLAVYACANTGLVCTTPPGDLIQQVRVAKGVTIFNTSTTLFPTGGGAPTAPMGALNSALAIRPDGQATAMTIFVTDNKDSWRVLVYHVTGGAYARQGW
jgi:prepilin-type N-terminal cleavage/methylation domain-containing protein